MEETKNFLDELLAEVEAKEVSLHLAHVDLVLGEISNLEEQIAKNFEETEKEKAILDDWTLRKNSKLQERIDWMSRKLEAFMREQGDDVKTIEVCNGKLLRRKQPNRLEIADIDDDLHHVNYGQLVWMAVPTDEYPGRAKPIANTRLKPVVLTFINDHDISHIAHGFDSKSLRKNRLIRWTDEAFNQGALLTQLDLAILLGVCDQVVSQYVQEIQKDGHLLPTRGNIHDLSGAITHKREIITLYLQGYLTPDIAMKTNHSKEAVDRYIKDYHRVEILWKHHINDPDQIAHLARLSKKVVQQYIDLLPVKIKNSLSKNYE